MKNILSFKLLTLVLVMLMCTTDIHAQKTDSVLVYDSYTFHKDTIIRYNPFTDMWYILNDTIKNNVIILSKNFDGNVTIDSITIYFNEYTFTSVIDYGVLYINNTRVELNTYYLNTTFSYNEKLVDIRNVNIEFRGIGLRTPNIEFVNTTIYYHYYKKNTSVDEVVNTNDVSFSNGKFHSSYDIKNIKLFDISGKLIQEGDLNDSYQMEKGKLYFVLFDNKYSKKMSIAN